MGLSLKVNHVESSGLRWLDSEKCLQLAMMADASDQAMALTRLLDSENVDPAILHREVYSFNATISTLFGDQKQCLTVFGYTSVMLKLLNDQLVWLVGGNTYGIGYELGVPQNIIEACLGRMRSYVILARAALSAEFPSFEVSQSFQVFDLSTPMSGAGQHLDRLAQALQIDATRLGRN